MEILELISSSIGVVGFTLLIIVVILGKVTIDTSKKGSYHKPFVVLLLTSALLDCIQSLLHYFG